MLSIQLKEGLLCKTLQCRPLKNEYIYVNYTTTLYRNDSSPFFMINLMASGLLFKPTKNHLKLRVTSVEPEICNDIQVCMETLFN